MKHLNIRLKPTDNIHFKRGLEELNSNNIEKALASFERGIELEPSHNLCRYNRGVCLMKLEKYTLALIDFNEILEKEPTNATFMSERGLAKFFNGDHAGAMADLDMAVEIDPEYGYRYSIRGFIKDKLGDTEGGIRDYYKAIELDPEDAITYNNLGLLEEKLGYKEHAQKNFKNADGLAASQKTLEEYRTTFEDIFVEELKTSEPHFIEPDVQQEPTSNDYIKVMGSVFTTKKGWGEFWSFIKDLFSSKNQK